MMKSCVKYLLIVFLIVIGCSKDEPTRPSIPQNNKPEIIRLSASSFTIGMYQTSTLSVVAQDQDGDELTYKWSATGGIFIHGTTRKFALWRAPTSLGSFKCQVTVSDGKEETGDSLTINVVHVPILEISVEKLDFSYNNVTQTFNISNVGEVDLNWEVIPNRQWIKVSPLNGTTGTEKDEISVTVDRTDFTGGYYTGPLSIRSDGGNIDIEVRIGVAIEPVIVHVPAGEFTMGSNDEYEDAQPAHTVYLDDYWIDKYEVTNAQYADFLNEALASGEIKMGFSGITKNGHSLINLANRYVGEWNVFCPINRESGKFRVNSLEANTPARFVTWYGALAYAEHYGLRLPTEAEWEKSAKGINKTKYPWGDSEPTRWDCNYNDIHDHAIMVGYFSPLGESPYGCCDMAGNMWEWCSSLYKEYPYNADDGREDLSASGYRVIRGGAWDANFEMVRCDLRTFTKPSAQNPCFGFRCVR